MTHPATRIRSILKRHPALKGISVRRGAGTAWGWTDIAGSGPDGEFTGKERSALRRFGIASLSNAASLNYNEAQVFLRRGDQ